jgi:hypothetical protein
VRRFQLSRNPEVPRVIDRPLLATRRLKLNGAPDGASAVPARPMSVAPAGGAAEAAALRSGATRATYSRARLHLRRPRRLVVICRVPQRGRR